MSYCLKIMPDKKFKAKHDFISFLKSNKKQIIDFKKRQMKFTEKGYENTYKGSFEPKIDVNSDKIRVKAVINTTNYIDSHDDLHMPPIWNKTVKDKPNTYHLNQHRATFEGILSSNAINTIKSYTFNELGLDSDMQTTALVSDFVFSKADNELLFNKYINGEVKQHSVGMRYIDIDLVMAYDDDEESQKELEDALIHAVNPDVAKEQGFVYVVRQAQRTEGSAVLFGSNPITPTLEVVDYEQEKLEPSKDTVDEKSEPSIIKTLSNQDIINILKKMK